MLNILALLYSVYVHVMGLTSLFNQTRGNVLISNKETVADCYAVVLLPPLSSSHLVNCDRYINT